MSWATLATSTATPAWNISPLSSDDSHPYAQNTNLCIDTPDTRTTTARLADMAQAHSAFKNERQRLGGAEAQRKYDNTTLVAKQDAASPKTSAASWARSVADAARAVARDPGHALQSAPLDQISEDAALCSAMLDKPFAQGKMKEQVIARVEVLEARVQSAGGAARRNDCQYAGGALVHLEKARYQGAQSGTDTEAKLSAAFDYANSVEQFANANKQDHADFALAAQRITLFVMQRHGLSPEALWQGTLQEVANMEAGLPKDVLKP